MRLYMRKGLHLCFLLLIACYMLPASAVANGLVPTLEKLPQIAPNREQLQRIGFTNVNLSGLYFDEITIQGNEMQLEDTYPFDINKLRSSYISLFSADGFVCNVKINSLEERSVSPDLPDYFETKSTFTIDCLKQYRKLPKNAYVSFVYPALDPNMIIKINRTVAEKDRVLIKSYIPAAIRAFAQKANLNIENERTTITKIGEKGSTRQFFVESFSTAGGYSLILAINSGSIVLQRIDNGQLSIRALFDVNYDGLADVIDLDGSVAGSDYTYGYRIIFDGVKWLGGLTSTPM